MSYGKMYQNIANAVAEITGEPIIPCLDGEMAAAIDIWANMYRGTPTWLSAKKGITSASIPSSLSAELAKLVTLELQVDTDKAISHIFDRIISEIRVPTEYACALGGVVFKPYIDGEGNISVQYLQADKFYPLAFDGSRNITQCVFVEQFKRGRDVYTRLEIHTLGAGAVTIDNAAYKSADKNILGGRVELSAVPQWEELEKSSILRANKLPVGFFRMPLANHINPDSPLGVSVYSKAVGLIEEADKKYSYINWEYEAKQSAIHIAESLLKPSANGDGCIIPDGKERLYRTLEYNSGASDKPLLEVFSPDIRATDLHAGYQQQLKMIEFACGLSHGTISDHSTTDKTATEIKSNKQRLYSTVTDIQKALQSALEDLGEGIALLLGLPSPTISFVWDDSIIVDSESLQRQKLLEYQTGIIDKVKYFVDVYGIDEGAATQLVGDMESREPKADNADFFEGGDG